MRFDETFLGEGVLKEKIVSSSEPRLSHSVIRALRRFSFGLKNRAELSYMPISLKGERIKSLSLNIVSVEGSLLFATSTTGDVVAKKMLTAMAQKFLHFDCMDSVEG